MEQKAGAQIGRKAFFQSLIILFVLMILAGILTLVVPAGSYTRELVDGREIIDPATYQQTDRPDYPIWRWFTAPIEVLWMSSNSLTVIIIIVFLLLVGSAFAILDESGILKAVIQRIVKRYANQKYRLLLIVSFFFMLMGAFFGIFEEVVPLIPLMLALAHYFGWDSLTGLGMSILATNLGFSAAVTNPFTIGIAQNIAGLPAFSGIWYRIIIFIVVYVIFAFFITRYAKRIEKDPESSMVYEEDAPNRIKYKEAPLGDMEDKNRPITRGIVWFTVFLVLILVILFSASFIPGLSDFALPLVGLLFFIGGVGAGLVSGAPGSSIWKAVREGLGGIAPGIPLILMAVSIKHIADTGGIMDTILHGASGLLTATSPFLGILFIYFLALAIEFFIGSASAKAFLIMPILFPLADLVGVTRQTAVTAYCFGDGFSNLAYPTNPVLLIALGLTVISYPKWMRWTLRLWVWLLAVTIVFLGIAVVINYGPF